MIDPGIWQSLEEASKKQQTGSVRRRVKPDAVCDVFLAITIPEKHHALLIKVPMVAPTIIAELPSTRGINMAILPSDKNHSFSIQLTPTETVYNQIFDILIADILEAIASARTEIAAVKALKNRLHHWQRFLERTGIDGLSNESQQGLYGELWFLREVLIPLVGAYVAISAWTGPEGAQQDFQLYKCAIEVKTSGTKEPQYITIHSERQLDDKGLVALFLQHLSLYKRNDVGETLPMIVDSLRQLLQKDMAAKNLYEDKLLEAGFTQSQAFKYEKTGYSIHQTSLLKITDSFPRIIASDLKPGVGAVKYSVAVSECRHFVVTNDELRHQLTRA